MKLVTTIISGMGLLIVLYLLLANGKNAIGIIDTIGSNTTTAVKVLQGRG